MTIAARSVGAILLLGLGIGLLLASRVVRPQLLLVAPVLAAWQAPRASPWRAPALPPVLAVVIALSLVDALLNAFLFFPAQLAAGGLAAGTAGSAVRSTKGT